VSCCWRRCWVASVEEARGPSAAATTERALDESAAAEADDLPVGDPWVDPARPHSAALDSARQLRMALLDQPDLPSLVNAVGALSAHECAVIVLELALDAWWTRRLAGGAGAERGDGGDGDASQGAGYWAGDV
jgi:hypothetical protein